MALGRLFRDSACALSAQDLPVLFVEENFADNRIYVFNFHFWNSYQGWFNKHVTKAQIFSPAADNLAFEMFPSKMSWEEKNINWWRIFSDLILDFDENDFCNLIL